MTGILFWLLVAVIGLLIGGHIASKAYVLAKQRISFFHPPEPISSLVVTTVGGYFGFKFLPWLVKQSIEYLPLILSSFGIN